MSAKQSILGSAIALIGAVGACGSPSTPSEETADTASAATACATVWSSTAVYTQGNVASYSGVNYVANWWTQGQNPSTNNGGSGSGQPWTSQGACGGTTPPPTDAGTPPPTDAGTPPPSNGSLLFSPYKDITVNMNWNTNVMQTAITGSAIPVVGSGSLVSTQVPNLGAITLAFATGDCGSEGWGGVTRTAFANANIPALSSAGLKYVVATGGAAGTFRCASQSGMKSFLDTYMSAQMVGVDYDIETGQSQADINNLVAQTAYALTIYPNLRFSFTLATLAASDGSYGGLNATGDMVVKAIKSAGLTKYTINLMVMDFGNTAAANCVVVNGVCNMGQSAIQAATNLQHTYGTPFSQIELTPMIGMNDTTSEVVSVADIDTITNYAVAHGLAGLHHWSLDRDTPCSSSSASSTCNSVPSSTSVQYTKRFLTGLGR